jgi:hypothetical protein
MITALQAAKLRAATKLYSAREDLLAARREICFPDSRAGRIDDIVYSIDELLSKLVTNERTHNET